jgi:hypothetical protein
MKMNYDHFAAYGFDVEYPDTWKVELNPKSEHAKGDVAFKAADGTKMFVSWGLLETVQKKYPSLDQQVDASVQRIKKDGQISHIEVLDRKEFQVHDHRAIYTRLSATVRSQSMFGGGMFGGGGGTAGIRELWAAHMRCEPSGRYFVVYGSSQNEKTLVETNEIYNRLRESFRCPCDRNSKP